MPKNVLGRQKTFFAVRWQNSVSETNFLDVQIIVRGVQIASDCQKLILDFRAFCLIFMQKVKIIFTQCRMPNEISLVNTKMWESDFKNTRKQFHQV